jgi:hypothetical protein
VIHGAGSVGERLRSVVTCRQLQLLAGHAGPAQAGAGQGDRDLQAVNQVETHPLFQRQDYQRLMGERGGQLESWGPFAEGRNNLFSDPTLSQIGNRGN